LSGAFALSLHSLGTPLSAHAQQRPPNPPLWRAQRDGKTVWLMGGFHAMKPQHLWLSPAIESAVRASRTVFFESKRSNSLFSQMESVVVMGLPPAQCVKRVVRGECREQFDVLSREFKLERFRVEDVRAQFAAFFINSSYMAAHHGYRGDFGLERTISSIAAPKSIKYLEGVHDAARAFATARQDVELQFLCWSIGRLEEHSRFVNRYIAAWIFGDIEILRALDANHPNEFEANALEVRDAAVVRRQEKWMPKVLKELDQADTVFVAVGFLHAFPRDGLGAMFANEGFDVSLASSEG
jgi:uncharacterized protein